MHITVLTLNHAWAMSRVACPAVGRHCLSLGRWPARPSPSLDPSRTWAISPMAHLEHWAAMCSSMGFERLEVVLAVLSEKPA
jgi:hypothetical protein